MGADRKKFELPQATDTATDTVESTNGGASALDSQIQSDYTLPEGKDVVIPTRRKHRDKDGHAGLNSNKSQTSLLIEYFEGGKGREADGRRPSVRVKVTPSSKSRSRSSNDHIQITERNSKSRKALYTQRIPLSDRLRSPEPEGDGDSLNSYRSATEESNVTSRGGGPIEVEMMPKRHGSPLIPTESSRYVHANPSEISSMPADSFLDGSNSPARKGGRSLSRGEALAAGALTGAAAAAVADKLKTPSRRRSRSLSRERIVAQKAVEKVRGDKSERRRKHSSRSRSVSGEHAGSITSPRRRSSRGYHVEESMVSGGDPSLLSSHVSGRSGDAHSFLSGTSKSSINNPKLLETVEDAIRRLILPELTLLKREQSKHQQRDRERDRRGSITSGSGISRDSREESSSTRRLSDRGSGTDSSSKPKVILNDSEVLSENAAKGRKDKNIDRVKLEDSPRGFERETSEETVVQPGKVRKKHSSDRHHGLEAAAAGAGIGALAAGLLHKHQSQDSLDAERKERRRRRTKSRSRSDSLVESYEEREHETVPPMPLMSDINASEITRSSILSADTERPHSASQERVTPIREVPRGVASPSSRTPTRTPVALQRGLGTQHSNFSRDNLSLQSPTEEEHLHGHEYELDEHGRKVPMHEEYDQEDSLVEEEHHAGHGGTIAAGLAGAAAGAGLAAMHHRHDHDDHDDPELLEEDQAIHHDAYYHQEVPPPLRYVPYAQERRGLSPIQSVSGYTEGDPDQQQRDSRLTQSTGSYSSLNNRSIHRDRSGRSMKSLDSIGNVHGNRHDFPEVRTGGLADSEVTQDGEYWEEQHRENDRQRDLDQESYRSSDPRADYKHMTNYTDDSMDGSNLDRVAAGQNVRGLGANPNFVHTPIAVESAVASLVNASELTGESGYSGNPSQRDRRESYASYEDGSEKHFTSRGNSPTKHDGTRDVEYGSEQDIHSERNSPSKYADEYELDEHGRKVAMPQYKNSHATEAAIAAGAAGAAAALIAGRNRKSAADQIQYPGRQEDTGAPLHKSFADRAQENRGSIPSPRHSIDAPYSETGSQQFTMGASGLPDPDHPMPEIGFGGVESDVETNPSVIQGPIAGVQEGSKDHWPGKPTPPQPEFGASTSREQRSDPNLKAAEAALVGGAVGLGGAEALANHSRENSHDHDEEWQRTSGERKRDTLITNPYEGTSPIAAIGALDRDLLGQQGLENDFVPTKLTFQTARPLASPKDEGYISSAPNARSPGAMTPEQRAKGVGFMDQDLGAIDAMNDGDPFYTPKHARHLSGMSHGMGSPIYDSATGNGIDRIQSKDIVALMDHLTVRDAQRSARDTEILVTLVRAAAEMRNSFEDMKRLLADTEDVIITEVQGNTEKSVQKVINGPRPQPQSASRSLRQGSQDEMYDDLRNKKRNVFRRALKGLSMKSTNDLGKIEEMLVQLLGDVEGLKVAQGLKPNSHHDGSYDDLGQEGNYEGDRGYEPEGNAGTSTASHASQSGHLSIPRGTSASRPFETRKFSDHRISTVPEGDEEEAAEHHEPAVLATQFDMDDQMDDRLLTPARGTPTRGLTPNRGFTPTRDIPRGGSAPLGTPPQQYMPPASLSNENTPNTPKTDKKKKHASSSSSGWIPKVSRWSETTASTVLRGFRSSGRSSGRKGEDQFAEPPSRSGSDLGQYADQGHDPYGDDKLHSGFSQDQLQQYNENEPPLPPEDPKYKAHRNSLNLQHPQPRPGPTHRYQTALESQAVNFDQPMSPKFSDWGSQTSLNRLPPQQTNRYSNGTSNPGNMSPISDGGYSNGSAAGQPPARPPKEPLGAPDRPPKIRAGKLIKPSPLSNEHVGMDDYEPGGSPRSAARKLSGALAIPTRKPTGPRSMSSSKSGDLDRDETVIRRKNRDTFGTIASNQSGESETF